MIVALISSTSALFCRACFFSPPCNIAWCANTEVNLSSYIMGLELFQSTVPRGLLISLVVRWKDPFARLSSFNLTWSLPSVNNSPFPQNI